MTLGAPPGEPLGAGADLQAAADLLAVVADPTRLAVLSVLTGGLRCVCDLQVQVPVAGNLLSYHLKVLREAGLITSSRRGRWVDYQLAPGALDRLHGALPSLGRVPAEAGDVRRAGAGSEGAP